MCTLLRALRIDISCVSRRRRRDPEALNCFLFFTPIERTISKIIKNNISFRKR